MSTTVEHTDDAIGEGFGGNEYTMEMMLAELGELMNEESSKDDIPALRALEPDEKALRLFEDLNVDIRWSNKFEEAGIFTVGDLVGFNTDELLGLRGIGITAIAELERGLSDKGLPTIAGLSRFDKRIKQVYMEHRSSKNRFRPFAADATIDFHTGPNHHIALDYWRQHTIVDLPFISKANEELLEQYEHLELGAIPGLLELIPFPQNFYLGDKETVSALLTCSLEHIITDCGFDAASKIVDCLLSNLLKIDPYGPVQDAYCTETASDYPSELLPIPLVWLFPEIDSGLKEYEHVADLLGDNRTVLSVYLANAIEQSLSRLLSTSALPIDLDQLFKNILIELDIDTDDRSIEIYIKRNGLGVNKMTLEEVGEELGVTRERIRQIESKVTERLKPLRSERLLLLRMAMLSVAKKNKAHGSVDDLNEAFLSSGLFSEGTSVSGLLELLPEYHVDKSSNTYVLDGYSCINCHNALLAIQKLRDDSSIVTHSTFWEIVGCKTCDAEVEPSISLFDGVEGVRASAEYIGAPNNPIMRASLKPTSERALLHAILYEADKALTYHEMIDLAFEKTGKKISIKSARSHVGGFNDCLLWGRGTYIYEKNAPHPTELLQIISDLISDVFKVNQIPIVGVEGIYSIFADQLVQQGIPTHQALYSLLRMHSDPRLKLQEYPWICDINTIGDRTSFAKYFYSILEDNNGFITDEHAKTIADKTMAQSFALGGLAEYSPFLINANGGWYDIESAGFDMQGIEKLANEVAEAMRDDDIVSTVKVFEDYRERCHSLGVKSYDILYYLIDMIEDDLPIEASRKPHLVKSSTKHMSVREAVRRYIRNSAAPVPYYEIVEEFKVNRGINIAGICNALLIGDDIVQTGLDEYWSKTNLGLSEEYIAQFEAELSKRILSCRKYSDLFYRRDEVLPNIRTISAPHGLRWNDELLKTVINNSEGFKLFGEHGSCLVNLKDNPNVTTIESFYYCLIENEFLGWASFDQFSEHCKSYGIRDHYDPEFFDAFDSIQASEASIECII